QMRQPPRGRQPGLWTRKDRSRGVWDLWSSGSGRSELAVWRDGVVLALIPVLLGLIPLITGHFETPRGRGHLVLDGAPARALGLAAIAFGACVHFHFYWGVRDDLSSYSQLGQIGAVVVFLAAMGYIAYASLG